MKYFQPKSLTWWAGLFAVCIGFAKMAGITNPALQPLIDLVAMVGGSGDTSPASLIFMGLGMIGLRAKLESM